MSQAEIEAQRLKAELERVKEMLAVRTALLGTGIISTAWKHNIQGFASSIRNMAVLLRHNFKIRSEESISLYLSMIEEEAEKILRYPVVPPLTAKEGLELVCVNDLLRKCDQIIDPTLDRGDVKLKLNLVPDEQSLVLANGWWMDQVLRIVIENGMKAMFRSSEKVMTISTFAIEGSSVEIILRDTGCGIPEDIRPKIFKEPIPKSDTETGLGMGLLLAMTIIQVYKGSIRLLSTNSRGTALAILLPQSASE